MTETNILNSLTIYNFYNILKTELIFSLLKSKTKRKGRNKIKQGNSKQLKEFNKKIVLKTIRDNNPISRTDLTKITDLSHTTISNITEELFQDNFLVEVGVGESKGGRKPILLDFNPGKYYFISMELAADHIDISLLNLNDKIIESNKKDIDKRLSKDDIISLIKELTNEILSLISSDEIILAMTIGVSGIINQSEDIIVNSAALGIDNMNIKYILEKNHDFPVYVVNDANLATLAEKHFRTENLNNFIYIFLGPSMGAGIVIENNIYFGNHGSAGEIGHIKVDLNGPDCFCGNQGCLISVLSSYISLDNINQMETEFNYIIENDLYEEKNYQNFCQYLSMGISNYIKINDPDRIILGGHIVNIAPKRFYIDISKLVRNNLIKGLEKDILIEPSIIKNNSIILGGSQWCFKKSLLE